MLPAHPAAALFPLMPEAELRVLADDIRAHGLVEPVVVHRGQVLDGRNRLAACRLADVEPRTAEWGGEGDPTAWIVSVNLHRRHLTESQRAMIAARLRPTLPKETPGPKPEIGRVPGGIPPATPVGTAARAASLLRVSADSVKSATAVVARGTPALAEAVDSGRVPVSTAAAATELPRPTQDALVARVQAAASPEEARRVMRRGLREERERDKVRKQEARRAELAARPALPLGPDIDIRLGDVGPLLCEVRGAGLVHADPPWPYRNRGVNGAADGHYRERTMADIVADIDAAYDCAEADCYLLLWTTFPVLGEWLAAARSLRWAYLSGGAWAKVGRIGSGFHWRGDVEPLLLYGKGAARPRLDATSNLHVSERSAHSEKPEAWLRVLVETFSDPGARVLDIYAGRAPLARACRAAGRRYVGAELDGLRHAEAVAALGGAT